MKGKHPWALSWDSTVFVITEKSLHNVVARPCIVFMCLFMHQFYIKVIDKTKMMQNSDWSSAGNIEMKM